MTESPLFYLIAGEASGDLLGARLIRSLRKKAGAQARFRGIGGPRMKAEGLDLFFSQEELAHMGLAELFRHLPNILKRLRQTRLDILQHHPTALITIDSPDFCFRIARPFKGKGIPLIHYVAPTVWAWRPRRAKKIAQFLDHLLALLPFEPPYFTREGLSCTFVGHSIVESDAGNGDAQRFIRSYQIPASSVLLMVLPGSRVGEVSCLLPIFQDTVHRLASSHPSLYVVIPTVPHLAAKIREQTSSWSCPVLVVESDQDKYDAMAASRAALACSGTIALELALARLPAVIAYKISGLTYHLYRRLIKVKYANLVNLMQDKMVVPELLQKDCTAEKLASELECLLTNEVARQTQITGLSDVASWLGQGHFVPSEKAAETVLNALHQRKNPS